MSERYYGDKKYVFEFHINHQDGTGVVWRGCRTIPQIREVIEGELKKLE